MAEFEIDGVSYKSRVFDGQLQLKIMKRLMPTFTAVGMMIEELNGFVGTDGETAEPLTIKRLSEIVMPVSREMAALPDKDVDFITTACMKVTEWRDPSGKWFPVYDTQSDLVAHSGNSRFIVRLKVTWAVIGENFSEMFSGFGIDLKGMMAKAVAK